MIVPVSAGDLSEAIQDYVKEIWKLQAGDGRATTSALAEQLAVAPSSVTAMLKKLAALGLAEHEPYRGVVLTPAGERVALEVIRHHRLLEQYLARTLGLDIELVHDEADRLEHVLSDRLEALIDHSLGYPTHDPHGHPIPDADLRIAPAEPHGLDTIAPGASATIVRVPDGNPELLRYLAEIDLLPGSRVDVLSAGPFGGPLTVAVSGTEHAISRELAASIGVSAGS